MPDKFLPDPQPRPPTFKCFRTSRELKVGMVVFYASRYSERLYEMHLIGVNRKENYIRYIPLRGDGRSTRTSKRGAKMYGVRQFIKTGELRKIP